MNALILTAGVLALLATLGHFAVGYKSFLKPVLKSNVDIISAKVMSSLFHYMSVYLILTTIILFSFGLGDTLFFSNPVDIVLFIGLSYAGFAIAQVIIALTAAIPLGLLKLFQWVFWALIAICCFAAV